MFVVLPNFHRRECQNDGSSRRNNAGNCIITSIKFNYGLEVNPADHNFTFQQKLAPFVRNFWIGAFIYLLPLHKVYFAQPKTETLYLDEQLKKPQASQSQSSFIGSSQRYFLLYHIVLQLATQLKFLPSKPSVCVPNKSGQLVQKPEQTNY